VQVNEIFVPYCASVHGMNFTDSSLATSISDLFLKAIVLNERKQQRDEKVILASIKEQPKAMQVLRGRASGLLSSYHTTARHHASELLHALFSTPRGARTKLPADKQDAVHAMLDLRPNEALLDPAHPVCKEYPAAAGGAILRVFPAPGTEGVQVFSRHTDKNSETAKFHQALGEFFFYIGSNCCQRKLILRCWQAASGTGGWAAWMICGKVHTTPGKPILLCSTGSLQQCTTSCYPR